MVSVDCFASRIRSCPACAGMTKNAFAGMTKGLRSKTVFSLASCLPACRQAGFFFFTNASPSLPPYPTDVSACELFLRRGFRFFGSFGVAISFAA